MTGSAPRGDIAAVLDEHLDAEFVREDVDATMATMSADPYVCHVPTLIGGSGRDGVRSFYRDHFIGRWPADMQTEHVSRTVGSEQVVDEIILSFTHDCEIDILLPGIAPTGRHFEVPTCVVAKFVDGKVAHEHIYWDQATVLVQAGLLDPARLPAVGVAQAAALRNRTFADNALLER